jgi:hypothetical protein
MNISPEDTKSQSKVTDTFVADDYGNEVPIIVVRRATVDEVRRWHAVLKFCPSVSFDPVEPRWNQPY